MIEADAGGGFRVVSPMLIGNARSLLVQGHDLLSQASAGANLAVDLRDVSETDSSALGVIFGWLRAARARGIAINLRNPPASMLSQATLYGVSNLLPLA